MKVNFEKGFSAAVKAGEKQWVHDRSTTVGASEVFSCIRGLRYAKMHPELADNAAPEDEDAEADDTPEEDWGAAERGNLIENYFAVPHLQTMYGKERCFFMGEEQRTLVHGRLSATPDGLVTDLPADALQAYGVEDLGASSNEVLHEIKSFSANTAPGKVRAKPRHEGQVNVQAHLMKLTTNYDPKYGVVLYFNASNLQDIRPRVVKVDPSIGKMAEERANKVFDPNLTLADFMPEGKINGTDCVYCKFTDACSKLDLGAFPDAPVKFTTLSTEEQKNIEEKAKAAALASARLKEAEIAKKLTATELREELFKANVTKASGKGWSASVSMQNGRKTLSKEAMLDAGLDPEDYMKEGNPFFVVRTKVE